MEAWSLIQFLLMVVIATTVQTITGFALGLILVALTAAFGVISVVDCAAIVSLISLMNTGFLLRRAYRELDFRLVLAIMIGLLPMLGAGFFWLDQVGRDQVALLKLIIGVMVLLAGVTLMLRPSIYPAVSPLPLFTGVGLLGGFFGGLFSAAGAPIAYLMYRQPLSIPVIRACLLAVFFLSTFARAILGGFAGHYSADVLLKTVLAAPVMLVTTLLIEPHLSSIPDQAVRRLVFLSLMILGAYIIISPG
jgi:uncharacterized membrane protein YfcA